MVISPSVDHSTTSKISIPGLSAGKVTNEVLAQLLRDDASPGDSLTNLYLFVVAAFSQKKLCSHLRQIRFYRTAAEDVYGEGSLVNNEKV